MVVQGDRDLDRPLEELLLRYRRGPPDVLQRFMGVKKSRVIKQPNSVIKVVGQHHRILPQEIHIRPDSQPIV